MARPPTEINKRFYEKVAKVKADVAGRCHLGGDL
jgi:hypothetical protein